MNTRPSRAERAHLARVKSLACSVCDAPGPSQAHHISQSNAWTCVALCPECHSNWHGTRALWNVRKLDQLGALAITIRRLMTALPQPSRHGSTAASRLCRPTIRGSTRSRPRGTSRTCTGSARRAQGSRISTSTKRRRVARRGSRCRTRLRRTGKHVGRSDEPRYALTRRRTQPDAARTVRHRRAMPARRELSRRVRGWEVCGLAYRWVAALKTKDQALAALQSPAAPCDACPARRRCAAELLACNALLVYVETGRAHDPRDFAPPTRGVFESIERQKSAHEHGAKYRHLKLPADKAAWAWAEFMETACAQL